MQRLVACRTKPYTAVHSLMDAGLSLSTLERLAGADVFRSLGLDRRTALWEVSALADRPIGLFAGGESESVWEATVSLPVLSDSESVAYDYAALGLSVKGHPYNSCVKILSP